MSLKHPTLPEAVRVAEEITDEPIEGDVLRAVRSQLTDRDKADIYELFDEGEISEQVAKQLLGETEFDVADATTKGSRQVLSEDSSRYISD
ncbi:hypothetical protein [Halorussus ruber]|uniref:hypothetical protein n=1 Tax=Halorussus ruber TaxID=1126238 RepID=UPI001092D410|nr:hypothetical protein [Halorussus ruber]